MLSQLDEILLMFGQPGRFQVFIAFLLCCIQIPVIFPKILLAFYGMAPPHRCAVRSNGTYDLSDFLPLTSTQSGKKMQQFSSCEMYINPNDHGLGTKGCAHGYEYMIPDKEWTIVSEWDLVCHKEYLVNLLPYLLSGGAIVGALVFGVLADQFERKRILLAAVIGNTTVSVALHFSTNFLMFASLYTLIGVLTAAVEIISFILLLELLPTPYQLKFCILLSVFWAVGELILTLLTWPVHHWRFMQLAVSVPSLICIAYFWLLPSSILWYVVHGCVAAAENELERLANYNGVTLPPSFRVKLKDFYNSVRNVGGTVMKQGRLELVCLSHKLRRTTFLLFFLWFTVWLVASTRVPQLMIVKDNQQMASLVSGFANLGLIMLMYFIINRLGPKPVQAGLLIFGGVLCITSSIIEMQVIPLFKPSHDYYVLVLMSRVSAMLGKEMVKVTIPCIFYHTGKHFPTVIRASGIGACFLWARVAEIVAPHLYFMVGESSWYLTMAASGILSILGGLLTLALPNCWHVPLPVIFDDTYIRIDYNTNTKCNSSWPYTSNELICSTEKSRHTSCTSSKTELHRSDSAGRDSLDIDYSVEGDAFLACLEADALPKMNKTNTNGQNRFQNVGGVLFDNCQVDSDTQLTDLEDELIKVWEMNRSGKKVDLEKRDLAPRDLQFFTRSRRNLAYEEDETVL